jgi:hypothetical protein
MYHYILMQNNTKWLPCFVKDGPLWMRWPWYFVCCMDGVTIWHWLISLHDILQLFHLFIYNLQNLVAVLSESIVLFRFWRIGTVPTGVPFFCFVQTNWQHVIMLSKKSRAKENKFLGWLSLLSIKCYFQFRVLCFRFSLKTLWNYLTFLLISHDYI